MNKNSFINYIKRNLPVSRFTEPSNPYIGYIKKGVSYPFRDDKKRLKVILKRIMPNTNATYLWIKFNRSRVCCYHITPQNIYEIPLCCSHTLCDSINRYSEYHKNNRWFEGTLIRVRSYSNTSSDNIIHFVVDDVYVLNGDDTSFIDWRTKRSMIKTIVKTLIKPHPEFSFMKKRYVLEEPSWVPITTKYSHMNSYDNKVIEIITNHKQIYREKGKLQKTIWTRVEPLWYEDGYILIDKNNKKLLIRSLEMSRKMNSIYRRIRENNDLDLLEESDDEDDFQNSSKMKWIRKDIDIRNIYICCVWNTKFNSWEPKKPFQYKKK